MRRMPHLHVTPAPPLSRFVELLWYYEEPPKPHAKERLMPDGCVSFIINLAEDETRLYDPDDVSKVTTFSPCSLSGPQTKCFVIDTDEQTCVVGASFRAGGAVPFLGLPSDELHNQHLNLEDLWDSARASCANRCSRRQARGPSCANWNWRCSSALPVCSMP